MLFLRSIIDFYYFFKKYFFSQYIWIKSSRLGKDQKIENNMFKDIGNQKQSK